MARVLLVEPYFGGSHRSWAMGLMEHSTHDVDLVAHDGNFWRWRLRGGALTLAEAAVGRANAVGPPDLIIASDMMDLSSFLGFTHRYLGDPAVVLYVHENQLMYPLGPNQQPDESFSLINWLSYAAADEIWFNSDFQREGVIDELDLLLRRSPDHGHRNRLSDVVDRMSTLPVGVELRDIPERPQREGPPRILWNQRWDHDKNPTAVFRALYKLDDAGVDFRLSVVGENQRVDPQEFDEARTRLDHRIDHFGMLERSDYVELLASSDVVVSAALHEFFGIAVVEAIVAGCVPVLPDRLSYPEIVPEQWHRAAIYDDGKLRERLEQVVLDLDAAQRSVEGLAQAMRRFDWRRVAPLYDARIDELLDEHRRR